VQRAELYLRGSILQRFSLFENYLFWSCSIDAKGIGTEILFATINPFGAARSFWIGPYRNQLNSSFPNHPKKRFYHPGIPD
jgi:hypothetical protein